MITANELRKKYLKFFESKGHTIIPSASLVPENDPTTLFTGSGMQPMVPYLLGEKHPMGNCLVNSQKCFRTIEMDDDDSIGDNRHTTFFEMLGNWSLGDYFKKEQIAWMFEFLTKELKLDPNKIYVSVYRGNKKLGISRDDEAVELWQEQFKKFNIEAKAVDMAEKNGMQDGRIFYYDEKENWWSRSGVPNNMPIGELGGPDSEIFWDFGADLKIHENSEWKNHPCHPACDCGRFLEIGNNVFMQYKKIEKGFKELKGKNIDFGGGLERLAVAVMDNPDVFMGDLFDLSRKKLEEISGKKYEENEEKTRIFRIIMDHLRGATFLVGDGVIPSNKERGYFVRRLVRRAIRFAHKLGVKENFTKEIAKSVIETYGDYYTDLFEKKEIILNELEKEEENFRKTLEKGLNEFDKLQGHILKEYKEKNELKYFINGDVAFYLYQTYGFPLEMFFEELDNREMVYIKNKVTDDFDKKLKEHQELSRTTSAGMFKGGLADTQEETMQLHTTAHLMLAGLRKILGDHVHQKGSNINGERVRFDFSHPEKMTDEQKQAVEEYVNNAIEAKVDVVMNEVPLDEARESGAEGAFENKYGDVVKVFSIEGFSSEICGGPHVKNTGDIKGKFRIKKEQSSSAGVRRIKAVLDQ